MKYNTKNFSFSLVTTPKKIRKINIFLLWFFAITLIILFLPWTQNFEMKGSLTSLNPADRPQSINSTIAGRIEKWYVLEGQSVKKGDTILFLSEIKDKFFDPNFLTRIKDQINAKENALGSTKQKSIALQKQIQALNDGLKFSINKAKNKVQQAKLKVQSDSIDFIAAQTNYKIAKQQFDRQIKLYEMDLKSKVELESRELKFQEAQAKLLSAENKFFNAKNDMVNAFIELNSIEAEYLDKISKSESDLNSTLAYMFDTEGTISKMNNDFANMQIRNSFYYITAPQDGMIVKALRTGIGETIKEGDEVVTIMPENPELAVEMYASAIDVAILNVNDEIRLQFEGWPALVFSGWPGVTFGTFGAKVKTIDKVSTGGKFRILATVDTESGHWPKQIRIGTNAKGWAMLKTVPVWFEIWRRLNSFPPEFRNDMPLEKKLDQKKGKTSTAEEKDEKDEK
ncbi:MAG: biotin/lipoyl-binding protein [Bacteroidetes bacterium]|jgi:multidrug efflux pump subunit AcrA (membrane-fusion protein)|nr:biotin/lipoyl-binding protein [Bacteroidota bacterium]